MLRVVCGSGYLQMGSKTAAGLETDSLCPTLHTLINPKAK